MKKAEILLENSINSQLCSHCGVCAGLCPTHAIKANNNVLSVDAQKCVDCGLCVECCPAEGYKLSDLTLEDIKDIPKYSIAANNEEVAKHASSGGFVTQSLLALLSMGEITEAAVVITGESLNESCAKYVMTNDPNMILNARRSKYTQASIDGVIEYIKKNNGKYAIVGLPCQLYGITQAMKKNTILRERIAYKFGMVCGYTYDEECMDGLTKVMGIERKNVKRILGWREGGLPGSFSVELTDGTSRSLPFADEHSLDVTYYAQNRCRLCRDCLCENGDVVSADIGGWKERRTLVLVRNARGRQLLNILEKSTLLDVKKCDIAFEQTVLPFMLREKRSKVDLRLKKNISRNPVWIGGYAPNLLLSQKIEALLSFQYEKKAMKRGDKDSAKKMLQIGHQAYHKISSLLILKVLFKLQIYGTQFLKKSQSWLDAVGHKMKQILGRSAILQSPKRIKAVAIGLGKWGTQYLGFLSCSKNFELTAIYDTDREKLGSLAKKFRVKPASSIEDLCKNYGADGIFILTPTPTHYNVFNQVSKYGLPIYIEKPISTDLLSARKMVENAADSNCMLYVAHSMKYEPAVKTIKELLLKGGLGRIKSFEITRSVKYKSVEYYENAALYQIGVHIIDVMLFLFGRVDRILCREQVISACRNYEYISVKMYDGCLGKLNYGFSDVYNFNMKIEGEKATLTYADSQLKLYTKLGNKEMKIPMIHEQTVLSQLNEFYFAVREQRHYFNTAENAMEIMKICDEIIKVGE